MIQQSEQKFKSIIELAGWIPKNYQDLILINNYFKCMNNNKNGQMKNKDHQNQQVIEVQKQQHQNHQSQIKTVKMIDQKIIKKLQNILKEVGKLGTKYPQNLISITKELIQYFFNVKSPSILQLILIILNPQMKFQSTSYTQNTYQKQISHQTTSLKHNDQLQSVKKYKSQSVIYALEFCSDSSSNNNSVIALPHSDIKIATYYQPLNNSNIDIGNQKNLQQNQIYFLQDQPKLQQYLKKPIKTVKRLGISQVFTKLSKIIQKELIEKILKEIKQHNQILMEIFQSKLQIQEKKNKKKNNSISIQSLILTLNILQTISPCLYTYYFLSLLNGFTKQIQNLFNNNCSFLINNSNFKKQTYESLIYSIKSLSLRFAEHKHLFNLEKFEWHVEQKLIQNFLDSKISQKQLYAVKVLIQRCRKIQYNSYTVINMDKMYEYMQQRKLLEKIYTPENHPQIIMKGKEVFEFVTKNFGLDKNLLILIFDLIKKSPYNLSKSLFITLQNCGSSNLQMQRQIFIQQILDLPRSNLYFNQTFTLLQSLFFLVSIDLLQNSLKYTFQILIRHYDKMKVQAKQKIMNIYFQLYLMGIQEGKISEKDDTYMIILKPVLEKYNTHLNTKIQAQLNQNKINKQNNIHSNQQNLKTTIILIFLLKMKQNINKSNTNKLSLKCKVILNLVIHKLFKEYHIVNQLIQINNKKDNIMKKENNQSNQEFELIKLLLEYCQKYQYNLISDQKNLKQYQRMQLQDKHNSYSIFLSDLLEEKQLYLIIQLDSYFIRYLTYYSEESQLKIVQRMLNSMLEKQQNYLQKLPQLEQEQQKRNCQYLINNIISTYYLMTNNIKNLAFQKIKELFLKTQQIWIKEKLVNFITKCQNQYKSAKEILQSVKKQIKNLLHLSQIQQKNNQTSAIYSHLLYLIQSLKLNDQVYGYGSYPPFKYIQFGLSYNVKIKVVNMSEIISQPEVFYLEQPNYLRLEDILKIILKKMNKSLKQIRVRLKEQTIQKTQTNTMKETYEYTNHTTSSQQITLENLKQKLSELTPYPQFTLVIEEAIQSQSYDKTLLFYKQNNHQQFKPQIVSTLKDIFNKFNKQYQKKNQQKVTNWKNYLTKNIVCRIFQKATLVNENSISSNDVRIIQLFNNYSQNGEYLTLNEWIKFYYQSAKQNPGIVIQNLKNLGYGDSIRFDKNINFDLQNSTIQVQDNEKNFNQKSSGQKNLREYIYMQEYQTNLNQQKSFLDLLFQLLKFYNTNMNKMDHNIFQKQFKKQQILNLIFQLLLKQHLPVSQKLKKIAQKILLFNKNSQNNLEFKNNVNFRQQQFQNKLFQLSLEKLYYVTAIINYKLLKIQLKQSSKISKDQLKDHLTILKKITLNKYQQILTSLLFVQSSLNSNTNDKTFSFNSKQTLDPLNLTYNEKIKISYIQQAGKLITFLNSFFFFDSVKETHDKKIYFNIKQLLNKQIQQIQPLQLQFSNDNKKREDFINIDLNLNNIKTYNFQSGKQTNYIGNFIERLINLCSINPEHLTNYIEILINQNIILNFKNSENKNTNLNNIINIQQQSQSIKQFNKALIYILHLSKINQKQLQQNNDLNSNFKNNKNSSKIFLLKLIHHLLYLLSSYLPQKYIKQIYFIENLEKLLQVMRKEKRKTLKQNKMEIIQIQSIKINLKQSQIYFRTLNQLILIIQTKSDEGFIQKLIELLNKILKQMSHSYDNQNKINQENKVLEVIIMFLRTTLMRLNIYNGQFSKKQSNLNEIQKILHHFLECQFLSENSISCIYEILNNFSSFNSEKFSKTNLNNQNLRFISQSLLNQQIIPKKTSKLNTQQNQGQVGLFNLGCICYVNSVIQQLYHISKFNHEIIIFPLFTLNQTNYQHLYFIELQKILTSMTYSKRSFLIPEQFCASYIDYTGQPINIKQQHDADEFLNGLLDKLQRTYEEVYNIQKSKSLPQSLLKGQMSNIITCQTCFTNKVNIQSFYVLTLEIKNLNSLNQCLSKMIEPQIICDYYCSFCAHKVQAIHKYRKIQKLPEILFIHLQRIVFDLQSFSKIKLDHPVKFQEQISFEKYIYKSQQDNLDNSKNSSINSKNYRLTGFIVHFGNSQGGHYISLIKNKRNKQWRKYDDSRISKWFWKTGIYQKDNAYLLIYERITEDEDQTKIQIFNQINGINKNSVNQSLLNHIKKDNSLLIKQLLLLKPSFGKFLLSQLKINSQIDNILSDKKSIQSINLQMIEQNHQKIQISKDFNDVLQRSKIIFNYLKFLDDGKNIGLNLVKNDQFVIDQEQICQLTYFFMKFLRQNKQIVNYFFTKLSSQKQLIKRIYTSSQKNLRKAFAYIFLTIIIQYQRINPQIYSYLLLGLSPSIQNMRKNLFQLQNLLSEVGKNCSKMDQYFWFMLKINQLSYKVREYFKKMNLVPKLVHFIMHKDSNLHQKLNNISYPLSIPSSKKLPIIFNTIIETIHLFISSYPQLLTQPLHYHCLSQQNFIFYKKCYNQLSIVNSSSTSTFPLNSILASFCYQNFALSFKVIEQLILYNINRSSHNDQNIIVYIKAL